MKKLLLLLVIILNIPNVIKSQEQHFMWFDGWYPNTIVNVDATNLPYIRWKAEQQFPIKFAFIQSVVPDYLKTTEICTTKIKEALDSWFSPAAAANITFKWNAVNTTEWPFVGIQFISNPDIFDNYLTDGGFTTQYVDQDGHILYNSSTDTYKLNRGTGENTSIYLNNCSGKDFEWTTDFYCPYQNKIYLDFKVAMMHEIGHVFGLGHNDNPSAIMYYNKIIEANKTDNKSYQLISSEKEGLKTINPNEQVNSTSVVFDPMPGTHIQPNPELVSKEDYLRLRVYLSTRLAKIIMSIIE